MREIKFRGWNKEAKKMINKIPLIDFLSNQISINANLDPNSNDFLFIDKQVVLMQYIGLKDKNDKEIYEGDIAKNLSTYYPEKLKVIYRNGGFCLVDYEDMEWLDADIQCSWPDNKTDFEIIGNIHENPELMEV